MEYPKLAEPDRVIEWAQTTMWEGAIPVIGAGPYPAWLRAWPSGHVHYSEDWSARTDGRFDTACCRTLVFWPEADWPKATVCRQCAAIFRSLVRAELRGRLSEEPAA